MSVTISVRFVHGLYHATGWDSAPNRGDVEWPPSPWRLARALLSVWYTRLPTIEADTISQIIDLLREPPRYWLPAVSPEHTRHYKPQNDYQTGARPDTTLTLDASVYVDPGESLIVTWPDVDAAPQVREALAALLGGLPYLGRAESVCEAHLVPEGADPAKDRDPLGWCAPDEGGSHRVLCLDETTTQTDLELRPDEVSAQRRLVPAGSRWVAYSQPLLTREERRDAAAVSNARAEGNGSATRWHAGASPTRGLTHVLRWRLNSPAPFLAWNGLLATEGLRARRVAQVKRDGLDAPLIHGHRERDAEHRPRSFDLHEGAHWLWLEGGDRGTGDAFDWVPAVADGTGRPPTRRVVRDVALWVPGGIAAEHLSSLLVGGLMRPEGYTPNGYRASGLQLVAIGSPTDCLPEFTSNGATDWVSATPFLSMRHRRKGDSVQAFVRDEVRREWARRHDSSDCPEITDVSLVDTEFDAVVHDGQKWAAHYRRHRWLVSADSARRRGIKPPTGESMVRIRFDRPIGGPLSLGGLSHFGFGLFMPMRDA